MVISSSGTTSTGVDTGENTFTGFITPAALTGTTFTFEVSIDNSTWFPKYDKTNTQLSVTVGTSRAYYFPPQDFASDNYVRIVSGSAEGAARTIIGLTTHIINT